MTAHTSVGFVGVGAMGGPMTARLASAGYPVRIYDLDDTVMTRLIELEGVEAAADAPAVAGSVDVLFTCLPNDAVVDAVYLGEDGLGARGRAGLVTVDCSTVSPGITQKVHAALATRGISHLDASMLGSVAQAETGQIGFIVGGEAEAFARVEPLLNVMGKMVRHMGPSGTANKMKLIHQTLVAGHAVAVAEALALCLATDTDVEAFYDMVCNGGGFAHSRYFENRVPRIRDGEFSPFFMLQFMLKDAHLASELIEDSAAKLPMLDRVVATLSEAQEAGWGEGDFSAVVHVLERRFGKPVSRS